MKDIAGGRLLGHLSEEDLARTFSELDALPLESL